MKGRTWWIIGVVLLILIGFPVALNRSRGIRNNNPGNLRPMSGGRRWDGEVAPDVATGGPFSRFEKPWQGWRAMGIDVFGDILQDRRDTIEALVTEYAPAADNNNVKEYTDALVKGVGVAKDFPLNVQLHGPALLKAIAKHENGVDPDTVWGAAEREKGVRLALERYTHA